MNCYQSEEPVYSKFWQRLKPLLTEPYDLATCRMDDYNKLGGVFAAGAMFCTLMTRCWYRHFDGEDQRMNPQVYLIGNPGSGKGAIAKMDEIIMSPVKAADKAGRRAEAEYKREMVERSTSTKAQKGEPLTRPDFCVRYLPSRTSNAVFFRRSMNAVEEINGEKTNLHLYTFDSELDGNTTAQSGGSWICKHDIELKAFHNEFTGVDFANQDSVNGLIQVFYNYVYTGTPFSLSNKITPRNVSDGLCSRIAIFKMYAQNYKMTARGNQKVNKQNQRRLKQWAVEFNKLQGELPIKKLVDHVYKLCKKSAADAELDNDKVLDYLRKRAVYYAIWFTVPRVLARAIKEAEHPNGLSRLSPNPSLVGRGGDTSKMESPSKKRDMQGYCSPPYKGGAGGESVMDYVKVEKSDLAFATLIYDAVIYWQDYFFGSQLEESWENAKKGIKLRSRNTRSVSVYNELPEEFTVEMIIDALELSRRAAYTQCLRWLNAGYIKRLDTGYYQKIVSKI